MGATAMNKQQQNHRLRTAAEATKWGWLKLVLLGKSSPYILLLFFACLI